MPNRASTNRLLSLVFGDQERYDEAVAHLRDGTELTSRGVKRIIEDLELRGNKLIYVPEELEVVSPRYAERILKQQYDDVIVSAGKGPNALYANIVQQYAGITRQQIRDFLSREPNYQMGRSYTKPVNKPIVTDAPDKIWGMDIIEIPELAGYNNQKRYILTVVDYFTSYLWTRSLRNKEGRTIRDALASIVHGEGGRKPSLLVSDNAKEFVEGEVRTWTQANSIKQSSTKTYSLLHKVEAINKQIRVGLRDLIRRNESLAWTRFLSQVTQSWNESVHAGQRHSPEFLYQSADDDAEEDRAEALRVLQDRAKRQVAKNKSRNLEIGDTVRVSLAAISTKVREQIKGLGTTKHLQIRWTPELYRVSKIISPPHNNFEIAKPQYNVVSYESGQPLRVEPGLPNRRGGIGRFYSSELLLVSKANEPVGKGQQKPYDLVRRLNKDINVERGDGEAEEGRRPPPRARRERTPPPPPGEERRGTRERRAPRRNPDEGYD